MTPTETPTETPTRRPAPTDLAPRSLLPAARATFALLVVSQVAVLVFLVWEPPFDGSIQYDDVAAISTSYWPMNVLLGGPAFALGAVALSVFLVVLGAGRGNALALTGTVLHLVGGVVFALVITAEVLPFAWAVDPEIAGEAEGRALFAAYNDRFDAFLPYILGSMAAVALGALVAVVGAAVSGSVGRWVPVAVVLVIVAVFLVPPGSGLTIVVDVVQRVLFVYLGWLGLARVTGRARDLG